jgi:GNAT superfamily N-acetyltransferase
MAQHSAPVRLEIQPSAAEHLPEVAALAAVTWRAHYPGIITHEQIDYMLARMYDLEVMRRELGQGIRYDRLLADGKLVAFAAYGPMGESEMKLHKLYVDPQRQRQGFGSRLLAHVEAESRRRGYRTLILAVNKGNTKATAAYLKNGWTIRESVVADIGGGFVMDDYIMAKSLA